MCKNKPKAKKLTTESWQLIYNAFSRPCWSYLLTSKLAKDRQHPIL